MAGVEEGSEIQGDLTTTEKQEVQVFQPLRSLFSPLAFGIVLFAKGALQRS